MNFLLNKNNKRYLGRPKSKQISVDLGTPELRKRRRKYKKLAETPAFYSCPLVQLFTLGHIDQEQLQAGIIYRVILYKAHNNMDIQLTTKSSLAAKLACSTYSEPNDTEQEYWKISKKLWDLGLKAEKAILDSALVKNMLPTNIYGAKIALEQVVKIFEEVNQR